MSASTESSPVSSPEINPFDSFLSSSYPVEELFLERPLVKSSGRPQRNWLPDFKEQVDKGITFYDLTVPHDARSHTVRVNLEFRKNSTGSDLWDASLVLAHYLGTLSPETFKNKNIVELGSGVGAVGLLCWKFGATVTLTDLPDNLELLAKNSAETGALRHNLKVRELVWGEPIDATISNEDAEADLVIGSDLFLPFAPELLLPLTSTIDSLLTKPNSFAIIAYEKRFDCAKFWEHCKTYNLQIDIVDDDKLHRKYQDAGRIFILRISRK